MRLASAVAAATLFLATTVHAADARAVLAGARQRIEATDARATGRLVRVEADGTRISNAVALKEHWFPGVLRVLVEIVPARTPTADARRNAHRIVRTMPTCKPGSTTPSVIPSTWKRR